MKKLGFAFVGLIGLTVFLSLFYVIPKWNVWRAARAGEATLRQAEFDRKAAIEEAFATMESAKHLAKAEIARAHGVAEANRIIGQSLAGNEAYLRYLWIIGLHDGNSEVIYVPTEAQLPLLEATRLNNLTP